MFDIVLAFDKDHGCQNCMNQYKKTFLFKRFLDLSFVPTFFLVKDICKKLDPSKFDVNVHISEEMVPFCYECFYDKNNLVKIKRLLNDRED
jgi:hypothetical protein